EQRLESLSHANPTSTFNATFRKCRESHRHLGPASAIRALLESAAVPVANLLGFRVVADVQFLEHAAVATLRVEDVVAALVVTAWGERLDPWWRVAVIEARRRGASWCLLFNGTHIRLVNASRVFSRRFAEFDLDCVADDQQTAQAMQMLIG